MKLTTDQKKAAILEVTEKCKDKDFRFEVCANNRLMFNKSQFEALQKMIDKVGAVDGCFTPEIPQITALTIERSNEIKV